MAIQLPDSPDLWNDLKTLCTFGGRFAGSESERKAREFLKQQLAAATRSGVTIRLVSGFNEPDSDLRYLLRSGDTIDRIHGEVFKSVTTTAPCVLPRRIHRSV